MTWTLKEDSCASSTVWLCVGAGRRAGALFVPVKSLSWCKATWGQLETNSAGNRPLLLPQGWCGKLSWSLVFSAGESVKRARIWHPRKRAQSGDECSHRHINSECAFVKLLKAFNFCVFTRFVFLLCRDQIVEMFDHAYGSYMVRCSLQHNICNYQ